MSQHKVLPRPREVNFSSLLNKYLKNTLKYLQTYGTVIVYVKHPENLLEVLLWTPVGHDIQNNHEFPEVNMTVLGGPKLCHLQRIKYVLEEHNTLLFAIDSKHIFCC